MSGGETVKRPGMEHTRLRKPKGREEVGHSMKIHQAWII